jgi:trehalose-6-phosphate synthase
VGRVNGRHGTPRWQPVRYLYRGVPRQELVALYRTADVALVTPLRDGMNLVAMEYAACQPEGGTGVLVLSEFTGAAHQIGRGAVLVNPFAIHETAQTLATVLAMSPDARRERLAELQRGVAECEVHGWLERAIGAALGQERRPRARSRNGMA